MTHLSNSVELYKTKVKPDREGWVYLIHAEKTYRYKIGRSVNPVIRHQILQKQSPYELRIKDSFYTVDAVTDEAELHKNLAFYRVHGEWFEQPVNNKNLMARNFYSYTNRQFQNDARIILRNLGVDFRDAVVEDCLCFFCRETLEAGKISFFLVVLRV